MSDVTQNLLKSLLQRDANTHHLVSYNHLLTHQIREIIAQYGRFGTLLHHVKYDIHFENVEVSADEIGTTESHHFGLNYTCSVLADVVLTTVNVEESHVFRLRTTLARLPLMTGRTCLSSVLDAEPYPITGAFIVRGKLRTLPPTKSTSFDTPIVMVKKKKKFLEVRSRHLNKSFRSTSTLDVRIDNNKKKTSEGVISIRLAFQKTFVHIFLVIRALGCTAEKFNALIILLAGDKYDASVFTRYLLSMKQNRFTAKATTLAEAEMCVAKVFHKNVRCTGNTTINNETLPHIHNDDPDREREAKVWYFARVCVIAILTEHNLIPESEQAYRDEYAYSQILSSSFHLGGLFRMRFIEHIKTCGKLLRRALMKLSPPISTKAARLDMLKIIGEYRLSARILSAVASGVWSAIRKGMSISLNNNNPDAVTMQMRRISSSLSTTDGVNTRPRNVTNDQFGFICAGYSADGESCGLVYELAKTAFITPPVPDRTIFPQILRLDFQDLLIDLAVVLADPSAYYGNTAFHMVYCMCMPIGATLEKDRLVARFYHLRRSLSISPYSFISRVQNVIHLDQDEGFVARPLIVAARFSDLTTETTFDEAVGSGIVEYVHVKEQRTICQISMSIREVCSSTTHIEITQSCFLGMMCSGAPYVTAQQGPRNTYYANQRKQNMTAHAKERRGGIATTHLTNSHKPLVTSQTEAFLPGGAELCGTPLIVAFLALEGVEEDAVIMNKAAAERGAMDASTTRTYASEAPPPNAIFSELFEKPGEVIAKKNVSYDAIEPNGLPKEGARIAGGDVVIAKTRSVKKHLKENGSKASSKFMISRRDISSSTRRDESGRVTESLLHNLPTGKRANITIRTSRPLIVGDKVTSRHAQKSTISALWPQEDMPVSMQTGGVPDLVASPLCLTSRMTMASLIEGLTGKAVALSGDYSLGIDNEEYDLSNKEHIRKVQNVLRAHGFSATGKERFMDGRTGDVLEGMVFVGVIDYMRLVHLASKKLHARSYGRRNILTRQPIEGRLLNGGLRIGAMESDALTAHGAAVNLQHRLREFSDIFSVYCCKSCQTLIDLANPEANVFYCERCHSRETVREVKLPFTFLVLCFELMATSIDVRLELEDDDVVDIRVRE